MCLWEREGEGRPTWRERQGGATPAGQEPGPAGAGVSLLEPRDERKLLSVWILALETCSQTNVTITIITVINSNYNKAFMCSICPFLGCKYFLCH